jgi:hypothetical protein
MMVYVEELSSNMFLFCFAFHRYRLLLAQFLKNKPPEKYSQSRAKKSFWSGKKMNKKQIK